MAHINVRPVDFTHPIRRNGSLSIAVKDSITKCLRALGGKTVQNGNTTTVNASVVQTAVNGLS